VGKRLAPGFVAGKLKADGAAEEEKAANGEDVEAAVVVGVYLGAANGEDVEEVVLVVVVD